MATGDVFSIEAGRDLTQWADRTRPTRTKDGPETITIDDGAPPSPNTPSVSAGELLRPAHQRLVFTDPVAFRRVREHIS